MNGRALARAIGWGSLVVGVSAELAPSRTAGAFGMGERGRLARLIGAKDLAIAAGLLGSENPRPWLLARAASDAQDAAILLAGLASGAFPRGRAAFGLAVVAGNCAASLALARRLR